MTLTLALIVAVASSCAGNGSASPAESTTLPPVTQAGTSRSPATTARPALPWTERDVTFPFEGIELYGILALPTATGPHPGIVLISGSEDIDGPRSGASSINYRDHARRMATAGFAVLRYDPPGVGRSGGEIGLPSLERRADETLAALRYVQSVPEVLPTRVGLWGESQGPWVIAMTAARHPQDVAFMISVVGSGVSVAEQQLYGIEAQTAAAGLDEPDVTKAVLIGRLLIDWQLLEPVYRDESLAEAAQLGPGPWADLADLVYEPGDLSTGEAIARGVEILRSVAGEPWAAALFLEELYIPRFERMPVDISEDELTSVRAGLTQNLMLDPKDFLTEVRSPLLAIFGENDLKIPTARSVELFEEYLTEAGNPDFTIVVIPDVDHNIGLQTPGYWELISGWLDTRYAD